MATKNNTAQIYMDELLKDCEQHQKDSASWMQTLRSGFDEKEAMLITKLEDGQSKTTASSIFDPRLSTIVFERSARVMAQTPKGKAYAVSKDDLGKNMLMNLMLRHYEKNANEQNSLLVKLRLLDLYSLVYGTMFALIPWRVNPKSGYIGPELNIIPIRDCFPQPGIHSLNEADWFIVRTVVSIDWLKQQDRTVWQNVDQVIKQAQEAKDDDSQKVLSDQNSTSYIERTYFPSSFTDKAFPKIELFTEYRRDKWITWTPQRVDSKTSRPFILRVVDNPYPDNMLPIVAKHAFPLLDSPIGMGEFERGKSLQYAVNSLINLYMDSIKYTLFPPLAISTEGGVVPSSIKWGAGEKWFMKRPNQDVQPVALSPKGLETFQSTYGFLLSALYNQSGTTEVSQTEGQQSSLGKTPDAIKFVAQRESARDEWDRVMMEETVKDIYSRWIALTVQNQEVDVEMRLYGDEINAIKEMYPDVTELYQSGSRGSVKINKEMISAKYDYELEAGSTMRPNIEDEQQNITTILKAVIENPVILESFKGKGQDIDISELFKRWLIAGGVKDYDKIIVNQPVAQKPTTQPQIEIPGNEQLPPADQVQPELPQNLPPQPNLTPQEMQQFSDQGINDFAAQILGGLNGIPRS